MVNTKLVCWTDLIGKEYEIEVPEHMSWMAWDEDGELCVYSFKPSRDFEWGSWYHGGSYKSLDCGLKPPEPGSWTDQLYWIGD